VEAAEAWLLLLVVVGVADDVVVGAIKEKRKRE